MAAEMPHLLDRRADPIPGAAELTSSDDRGNAAPTPAREGKGTPRKRDETPARRGGGRDGAGGALGGENVGAGGAPYRHIWACG